MSQNVAPAVGIPAMTPIDVAFSFTPPPPVFNTSQNPSTSTTATATSTIPMDQTINNANNQQQGEFSYVPPPPPEVTNHPPPTKRSNPGLYLYADQQARRVLNIDAYEGLRIELSKPQNQGFATSHTITMAPATGQQGVSPNSYQFGANAVVGDTLLLSTIDHDGKVNAKWHQQYSSSINGGILDSLFDLNRWGHKIHADLSANEHESNFTADFERRGDDSTTNFKVGSGTILGFSYFQAVTPRLALGGDGIWHGGKRFSMVSGRARYTDNNITATVTAGSMATISSSFVRRINDRVALAAELEIAPLSMDGYASTGLEFVFRQARLQANVSSFGVFTDNTSCSCKYHS